MVRFLSGALCSKFVWSSGVGAGKVVEQNLMVGFEIRLVGRFGEAERLRPDFAI